MNGNTRRVHTADTTPCVCDSRYVGCKHPNPCGRADDGSGRGPWCPECQPRRLDAVSLDIRRLRMTFTSGEGVTDCG